MLPISDPVALSQELTRQLEILEFGVVEITPRDEFVLALKESLRLAKPLRVKCGIDPTRVDIHLGHFVPYRKMRAFQDLGHQGVVVIGDYTAQIGDPSGRDESRKFLGADVVKENCRFYERQLLKVLDKEKTEFRYQSEWYENGRLTDVLSWAAQTTVAKLISHDTFRKRMAEGLSLGLHELFYPVLQGMDSVQVCADVELGGSDQKFNVLMGRDYQKNRGQRPQAAMLFPLVTGLDGHQKMSASLDNYIGVEDEAFDMFGKVMSIGDDLMLEYFKHLACLSPSEYRDKESQLQQNQIHPNEAKKQLAARIVDLFHGSGEGEQQRKQFERVFSKKKIPDDVPLYEYSLGDSLMEIIMTAHLLPSKSEVRRMLSQGGVGLVDGDKLTDEGQCFDQSCDGKVLKVGKRKFLKLKFKEEEV